MIYSEKRCRMFYSERRCQVIHSEFYFHRPVKHSQKFRRWYLPHLRNFQMRYYRNFRLPDSAVMHSVHLKQALPSYLKYSLRYLPVIPE